MERLSFAATGSIEGNTLSGVAHTFGTRTKRGSVLMEFAAGSFDKALANSDVRAFWNHDTTYLLGRQSAGTVTLTAAQDGLHYSIDLPDTSYAADLKALIARGDLSEMSFGITPGEVAKSKDAAGNTVITHTSVASIFDISPVSLPAFDGTTTQLHSEDPMDIPEIMDAMQTAADAGDNDTFAEQEAALEAAQKTEANRARIAELRKVPVGMPAVIRATPKGDNGLDFAFEQYLRTGQANSDLTFAQTVGSTTGGGFTVPESFLTRLQERRVAFGGLMNVAESLTTGDGRPLSWPSVVPAVYTEADIAAEGAASAAGADIVFGEVTLGAFKYTSTGTGNVPLKVSVELLQDASFDIAAYVARHLGERIARKQAYDLCNGAGTTEPLGIAYGTAGTIEADIATYANLNNLVHALDPWYRPNAKWIMNDATMAIIENLADSEDRPLLVPGDRGFGQTIGSATLLGYPVVIDQAMPTMNTDNVIGIAFGDWQQAYIVRHVKDVQVLANPYGTVGYVQFDAWARMDGKIQNTYAMVTGEGV